MAAENQDFTLYQGEDEQVDFYVTDSDGSPKNLTGASIEWGMWLSDTRILTKTTGSGVSSPKRIQSACSRERTITNVGLCYRVANR